MTLRKAEITGGFWKIYHDIACGPMLHHQWEALNDRIEGAAESHAVSNLRKAAGLTDGGHRGMIFSDSDLAKWLEAASYAVAIAPKDTEDPELVAAIEEVVVLYETAQMEDGYINSYFQLTSPDERWTNLQWRHELYCIGHFIEAAVAYQKATGSDRLTEVARRAVSAVRAAIGPEPAKLRGYPGHEEIELALVKLADLTGDREYLGLARYFLDERGVEPNFFAQEAAARDGRPVEPEDAPPTALHEKASYSQAHLPVRDQSDAVGHSVRAMYLYTAMADLALRDNDEKLATACRRLWESTTQRRMYVTGGIGSTRTGEAFTYDYDLPGDIAYAETCAAIGLVFFARRMLNLEPKGEYGDVMERALYNGVLSGMSLDGKGYFYVNPLIVNPAAAAQKPETARARPHREPWKGCACCPPNIARLVASIHEYAWSTKDDTLFIHLYLAGEAKVSLPGGDVTFATETDFPWNGTVNVDVTVEGAARADVTLALRIPDWCDNPELTVNGSTVSPGETAKDGYAYVKREWRDGDAVRLNLPMTPRRIYGAPQIVDTMGKVALQRGPLVYCLEEVDNGDELMTRVLPKDVDLEESPLSWGDELPGVIGMRATGQRLISDRGPTAAGEHAPPLYTYDCRPPSEPVVLEFVPYFAWANRDPGEMIVWLREG